MSSEQNYRGNPIGEELAKLQVHAEHIKAMEQTKKSAPGVQQQNSTENQPIEEEKR